MVYLLNGTPRAVDASLAVPGERGLEHMAAPRVAGGAGWDWVACASR